MITGIYINTMGTFLLFKLLKVLHILTIKRGSGLYDYLLCYMQIYNKNLIFCNCIGHNIKSYRYEPLFLVKMCNTFNSLNSKKVRITLIYIPVIMFINT